MNDKIKTPALITLAVVVVGAIAYFGFNTINNTGNLDQGQVKYTPGKPPWEETDPSKRGPGGTPGAGGPPAGASPAGAPPVLGNN